jgi:hypothetical protein
METEKIENVNSETTQNETVNNTTLTVDDYNKLMAEKLELEKKNAKLYARLKKDEESSVEKPLVDTKTPQMAQELTRLKLRVEHGIDDPEALDFIMKNGGEDALKNEYMKKAVETILTQKKAEKASVDGDNSKSEFEKKYSTEQLRSMSSEELEKILPH